jgi:prepilin-type N-terminal cleavage/methylation domain-containing protein
MCTEKAGLTGLPARAGRNLGPGPLARRGPGPAFTLAELIVVMVILGVMAALVIPYASSNSGTQAQAAARMLTADIEYAQNLATVTQGWVQVNFDAANKHYWITNASGDVAHPITQKSKYEFFFGGSGFDKVTLANPSFGGPNLRFGPLGDPVSGGSVKVVAGATSYTITVAPVTGKATVTQP